MGYAEFVSHINCCQAKAMTLVLFGIVIWGVEELYIENIICSCAHWDIEYVLSSPAQSVRRGMTNSNLQYVLCALPQSDNDSKL